MADHFNESGSTAPLPEGQGNPPGPPAASHESPEAQFKHPHPAPASGNDSERRPSFPLVLGAIMLLVLVFAWVFNMRKEPAPTTTVTTSTPAPAEKPAEPEADSKALKADLDGLKTGLKALQDRLAELKPAPAVDLAPLTTKVSDLAKETEALAALPKKVSDLDQRLDGFDKTLATLRSDLDALRSDIKKAEAAPTPVAGADATKPGDVDAAVVQAAALFKAGKYKEASDAFQKLTESSPNDARVWYFAALARGSATSDWTGETLRMVQKGVELEKAGTTPAAKIDAAFTDVNPSFKPWIEGYRKMAKAP
jgi:TolA-binding protein